MQPVTVSRQAPRSVAGMAADTRRQTGSTGEQLAAEHLARRGFAVVARNFRTRWGELDIVAFDGHTLVFCEVKCRRASAGRPMPEPLEAVRPAKRLQVRRMAARWLVECRERPRAEDLRFDVIGVTLDGRGRLVRLDHLEAAF